MISKFRHLHVRRTYRHWCHEAHPKVSTIHLDSFASLIQPQSTHSRRTGLGTPKGKFSNANSRSDGSPLKPLDLHRQRSHHIPRTTAKPVQTISPPDYDDFVDCSSCRYYCSCFYCYICNGVAVLSSSRIPATVPVEPAAVLGICDGPGKIKGGY
jgi:hypothetical protein